MTAQTFEITNTCQCYDCTVCAYVSTGYLYGKTCEHCENALAPTDHCDGFCTDINDIMLESFEEWLENTNAENGVIVIGTNVGWRNLSGVKILDMGESPIKAIAPNSEYTQHWTIGAPGEPVKCLQSHHDSPCGEGYTLAPRIGCLDEYGTFSEWDY